MKGILLEDYSSCINDYLYIKGQKVDVTELESFNSNYAVYRYDTVDWIPKHLLKII